MSICFFYKFVKNKTEQIFESINNIFMITAHPQYIKATNGKKSFVILPAKEFDSIME
ncbi:MAG: hypothetical protein IPP29_21865 [Bacteroidetes bacterium]|nr:hypothetical protein [Bacteroidota bacterium]